MPEVSVSGCQKGMALPEVLLAILLLSAGVAGCLQYQQWIVRAQWHQQQENRLWQTLPSVVELCRSGSGQEQITRLLEIPAHWRWHCTRDRLDGACERLTVEISAPLGLSGVMTRDICLPAERDTQREARYD